MKKICTGCVPSERWLPTSIQWLDSYLDNFFKTGHQIKYLFQIRKNIAYNTQYLQFQSQLLKEFETTQVILTQTWKMYIIVGTSIIECILYYLIISKGKQKTTEWEEINKSNSQTTIDSNHVSRVENIILKKISNREPIEMSFDTMIKIVKENKLLGSDHDIYKKLNYLRKLRNKVHLQIIEDDYGTDWHKFQHDDIKLLKTTLYLFFTSKLFSPSAEDKKVFDFLIR